MVKKAVYLQEKEDRKKFNKDIETYNSLNVDKRFVIKELSPMLTDYRQSAGNIGGYFWQDLWGARCVLRDLKPNVTHYDIGSRVDGFIAHLLSAGINVCLIDIRPLEIECSGLDFICSDATKLNEIADGSIESISALCSLEHFGLGRYNDPINPDGCFQAFRELQRVVKVGGRVYLSLPIGNDKLLFNESRIFKVQTILDEFNKMKVVEFNVMNEKIENNNSNITIEYNCDIHKYDDYEGKLKTGFFVLEKIMM